MQISSMRNRGLRIRKLILENKFRGVAVAVWVSRLEKGRRDARYITLLVRDPGAKRMLWIEQFNLLVAVLFNPE